MFPEVEDEDLDQFGEHLVTNSTKLVFLDKLLKKIMAAKD